MDLQLDACCIEELENKLDTGDSIGVTLAIDTFGLDPHDLCECFRLANVLPPTIPKDDSQCDAIRKMSEPDNKLNIMTYYFAFRCLLDAQTRDDFIYNYIKDKFEDATGNTDWETEFDAAYQALSLEENEVKARELSDACLSCEDWAELMDCYDVPLADVGTYSFIGDLNGKHMTECNFMFLLEIEADEAYKECGIRTLLFAAHALLQVSNNNSGFELAYCVLKEALVQYFVNNDMGCIDMDDYEDDELVEKVDCESDEWFAYQKCPPDYLPCLPCGWIYNKCFMKRIQHLTAATFAMRKVEWKFLCVKKLPRHCELVRCFDREIVHAIARSDDICALITHQIEDPCADDESSCHESSDCHSSTSCHACTTCECQSCWVELLETAGCHLLGLTVDCIWCQTTCYPLSVHQIREWYDKDTYFALLTFGCALIKYNTKVDVMDVTKGICRRLEACPDFEDLLGDIRSICKAPEYKFMLVPGSHHYDPTV
jgi:hypothetical protein